MRDQINGLSSFCLNVNLAALDTHAGQLVCESEKDAFKVSMSGSMRCSEEACFAVGRRAFVAQVYRV